MTQPSAQEVMVFGVVGERGPLVAGRSGKTCRPQVADSAAARRPSRRESGIILPPYSEFGDCPSAVDCGDASSVRDLLARVGFTGHRAIAYGDLK